MHIGEEAAPVAEWLRPLIFSVLNRLSSHSCGFEPSSVTWDKPSSVCVWLCVFSWGISHFHPTWRLILLKMSEIILTGHKTQIKKKINAEPYIGPWEEPFQVKGYYKSLVLNCHSKSCESPQASGFILVKYIQVAWKMARTPLQGCRQWGKRKLPNFSLTFPWPNSMFSLTKILTFNGVFLYMHQIQWQILFSRILKCTSPVVQIKQILF